MSILLVVLVKACKFVLQQGIIGGPLLLLMTVCYSLARDTCENIMGLLKNKIIRTINQVPPNFVYNPLFHYFNHWRVGPMSFGGDIITDPSSYPRLY